MRMRLHNPSFPIKIRAVSYGKQAAISKRQNIIREVNPIVPRVNEIILIACSTFHYIASEQLGLFHIGRDHSYNNLIKNQTNFQTFVSKTTIILPFGVGSFCGLYSRFQQFGNFQAAVSEHALEPREDYAVLRGEERQRVPLLNLLADSARASHSVNI